MLGLYLHIPFCQKKCNYCAFNSFVATEEEREKYIDHLVKDIRDFGGREIDTIYLGGGTPSLLSESQIRRLSHAIKENFVYKGGEFTIEVNPNSLSKELLATYKEVGINRLSIGVQCLDDKGLSFLGRLHTKDEAIEKIKLAKEYFDNISCDLIIGIPNRTPEDYIRDLKILIDLGVKHISTYMLQVEDNTPLKQMVLSGAFIPDDDECALCYEKVAEFLENQGFWRYEVSNFGKKGYESRHNIKYWKGEEYLGLGAGAHSLLGRERFSFARNLEKYYRREKETSEILTDRDLAIEHIMLGLRSYLGIDKKYLQNLGYDIEKNDYFNQYLSQNILLIENKDKIILNPKYYTINNYIITNLMPN